MPARVRRQREPEVGGDQRYREVGWFLERAGGRLLAGANYKDFGFGSEMGFKWGPKNSSIKLLF